eukprot:7853361-Pyramimonas_sp.AAC.1
MTKQSNSEFQRTAHNTTHQEKGACRIIAHHRPLYEYSRVSAKHNGRTGRAVLYTGGHKRNRC